MRLTHKVKSYINYIIQKKKLFGVPYAPVYYITSYINSHINYFEHRDMDEPYIIYNGNGYQIFDMKIKDILCINDRMEIHNYKRKDIETILFGQTMCKKFIFMCLIRQAFIDAMNKKYIERVD